MPYYLKTPATLFVLPATVFVLMVSTQAAFAGPFCVQTQAIGKQCDYFDAAQCRQRAQELSGFCVVNASELVISPGSTGRYCLVSSDRHAQCIYPDRTSCDNDAVSANSVCIEKAGENIQQDPYQLDVNKKY